MTPEEGQFIGQYNLGYQQSEAQIPAGLEKHQWHAAHSKYHYSDVLKEEIFTKLLTPQIRAQWAQTNESEDRRIRANQEARNREIEAERGPFRRAPAGTAGHNSAPIVGAADPSIAKAKAAKVDISIVGLQFGEPLRLPECSIMGDIVVDASTNRATSRTTCVAPEVDLGKSLGIDVESITKELFGVEVDKSAVPAVTTIQLSGDSCPAWVTQCTGHATLHNGRLAGIAFFTPGRGYEKTVTSDLQEKYGLPTRVVPGTVTPDTGNVFRTNEPEWTLPGLYIVYEVVLREEGSDRISTNKGIVRIMTESERQRRLARQKAKPKPKL